MPSPVPFELDTHRARILEDTRPTVAFVSNRRFFRRSAGGVKIGFLIVLEW